MRPADEIEVAAHRVLAVLPEAIVHGPEQRFADERTADPVTAPATSRPSAAIPATPLPSVTAPSTPSAPAPGTPMPAPRTPGRSRPRDKTGAARSRSPAASHGLVVPEGGPRGGVRQWFTCHRRFLSPGECLELLRLYARCRLETYKRPLLTTATPKG